MEKYRETVHIKMEELPEGVKMGDRAEIKLVKDFSENAVKIPKRALKSYLGKDVVYVLEDGIRIERYVQKGVQSVSEVEITEGIRAGEQVIIEWRERCLNFYITGSSIQGLSRLPRRLSAHISSIPLYSN